jgi:UDPglucose--hexose-1-phosphate uridylyltransferase
MSNCTRPRSPALPNSVPERRCDVVTGQWVILAGGRQDRPQEFVTPPDQPWSDSCAFCAGREEETTAVVASYASPTPGSPHPWQVRVVGNLYPAFIEVPPDNTARAVAQDSDSLRHVSLGQHEVIIESPTHRRHLTELSQAEVELVFAAYHDRLQSIVRAGRFKYATIFKNSGRDAGMSREHLHSQLVALPEVPPLARQELAGAEQFLALHGQCVFCFLYDEVRRDPSRLVLETDSMVAFCPFASRVPYEVWVLPKPHQARFDQASPVQVREVAALIRETLQRLETCLGQIAYNYLLHTNPFDTCRQDHYHWHIEILPRTGRLAGLEWGTGLLINTMPPEVAAGRLRGVARA